MNDDVRLDNDLAAYTDRVLSGEPAASPGDAADAVPDAVPDDLRRTVQHLYRLVDPATPPDAAFQARLAQRLEREWTVHHRARRGGWSSDRVIQLATLAAALLVLIGGVVMIGGGGSGDALPGASVGDLAGTVVLVGIMGLAFLVWYVRQRDQ